MKTFSSLLALMVLLTTSAWSQSASPQNKNAETKYVGSFTVELDGSGQLLGTEGDKSGSGGDIISEILVMRSGTAVNLQINTVSIRSTSEAIDNFASQELFNLLSRAGIQRAMQMGLISNNSTPTVYTDGCYTRTGSGSSTHFAVCSPQTLIANYYKVVNGKIIYVGSDSGSSLK